MKVRWIVVKTTCYPNGWKVELDHPMGACCPGRNSFANFFPTEAKAWAEVARRGQCRITHPTGSQIL